MAASGGTIRVRVFWNDGTWCEERWVNEPHLEDEEITLKEGVRAVILRARDSSPWDAQDRITEQLVYIMH